MKFRTISLKYAPDPPGGGGGTPAHVFQTDKELQDLVNSRVETLLPQRIETAIQDRFKNYPTMDQIKDLQSKAEQFDKLQANGGKPGGKGAKEGAIYTEEDLTARIEAVNKEWTEKEKGWTTSSKDDGQLIEDLVITNAIITAASRPETKALDSTDVVNRLKPSMKLERFKGPDGKPKARAIVVNEKGELQFRGANPATPANAVEDLAKSAPHLFAAAGSVTAGGGGGSQGWMGGFNSGPQGPVPGGHGFTNGPAPQGPQQIPGQAPANGAPPQGQGAGPSTRDLMVRSPMLAAFANSLGSMGAVFRQQTGQR